MFLIYTSEHEGYARRFVESNQFGKRMKSSEMPVHFGSDY